MLLGSGLDIETQCGFYIDYCACIFILGCVWNDHAKPSEAQDINDNRLKQVLSRIPPYCTAKLGTQATHTGECLIKIVNSLTNYCKTKSHRDLLVELINVANAEPNSVISKICTPMIQHLRMYQYVYISVMYHIISLSEVSAMVQLPQEQVLKGMSRRNLLWINVQNGVFDQTSGLYPMLSLCPNFSCVYRLSRAFWMALPGCFY